MDLSFIFAAAVTDMATKMFSVPVESDGWRADRFLLKYFPQMHSSFLKEVFSRRDVKVNGIRVRPDFCVSVGDEVRIYYMETAVSDDLLSVVYEDKDILLVNKRSGISVEPDAGGGLSLTDLCLSHVRREDKDMPVPQPCHRIDNKTCGLVLFAKNELALSVLLDVFKKRSLEKYYVCLVKGFMKPPAATCTAWLTKDPDAGKVSVTDRPVEGSKEIVTAYETLENGQISRLRVHLITGRTHQIRAHMSSLGHPLLGDDIYGDRTFNKVNKCRQLKLCATELILDTGGRLPELDGKHFSVSPPF